MLRYVNVCVPFRRCVIQRLWYCVCTRWTRVSRGREVGVVNWGYGARSVGWSYLAVNIRNQGEDFGCVLYSVLVVSKANITISYTLLSLYSLSDIFQRQGKFLTASINISVSSRSFAIFTRCTLNLIGQTLLQKRKIEIRSILRNACVRLTFRPFLCSQNASRRRKRNVT